MRGTKRPRPDKVNNFRKKITGEGYFHLVSGIDRIHRLSCP